MGKPRESFSLSASAPSGLPWHPAEARCLSSATWVASDQPLAAMPALRPASSVRCLPCGRLRRSSGSSGRLPFGPRPRAVDSRPLHCRVRGLPAPRCQLPPLGLPIGGPFGSARRPLLRGASPTHPSDRHPKALHQPRRTCGGPPAPGPHGPFAGSVPDRSGPATPRITPVRGIRTICEEEGSETRFSAVIFANWA